MFRFLLPAVLFVGACGVESGSRPEAVLLERDRVTVSMSSGWPCLGFRTAETRTADGWAGRLEGCPDAYAYKVTLQKGSNPVRTVLVEVLGALGGEDLLRPAALVEITSDRNRVYRFRTP
ncbi:hypothetical protein [Actibacterium lipolyticum]|uniref:Uncharacterized protein n=1 Tax=Actibacterium lipolyticum TaxID=1524263 RepID=A0A238JS82_9RHOB|nr:hypothetical protein [Actibacterium lipolyticum]SMX32606.1 hypothetical protein COL8621_00858 [Actibacterium lipolyticum]